MKAFNARFESHLNQFCFGGGGQTGDNGASAAMMAQSQSNAQESKQQFQTQQQQLQQQQADQKAAQDKAAADTASKLADAQKTASDRSAAAQQQAASAAADTQKQTAASNATGITNFNNQQQQNSTDAAKTGVAANNAGLPGFGGLTNFRKGQDNYMGQSNSLTGNSTPQGGFNNVNLGGQSYS